MSTHQPMGTACDCGARGWMPGVEHAPIQWQMHRDNLVTYMEPLAVVDHIMQGYLTTMVDWTRNGASRVIAHFGIARDGRIVQMHPIFSPGVHATYYDHTSQYVAKVVRGRWTSPNTYTIGIEHEGCSVRPPYTVPDSLIYGKDNPWPEAMVEASVRVKAWCFATAPSLGQPSSDTIIGHYETGDPTRVDDPSARAYRAAWPRAAMIAALTKSPPKGREEEKPVKLTATQQYVVDEIRKHRASLTDEQVAEALALVGLDAMPGEEPAKPPAKPATPPASGATREQVEEVRALAARASTELMRLKVTVDELRMKTARL